MKKQYRWEDLKPSSQVALARRGDPRVPPDFKLPQRTVGRPRGIPQPLEVRRKLSAHAMSDPVRRANRTNEAMRWLFIEFGTIDAITAALTAYKSAT